MTDSYTAPVEELNFILNDVLGCESLLELPAFADLDRTMVDSVLTEGARFCEQVLAPLNAAGDAQPAFLEAGRVRMPTGYHAAYRQFAADGWLGLDLPPACGGQGLPRTVQAAFAEMVNGACVAFAMLPVTQRAAARLLMAHGSEALKAKWLEPLVRGEVGATIVITEAGAGSDVGRIATLATPAGDGRYLLNGTKIFISNGDQDLTNGILHMVLARTPDAPAGTRGLSLFLVPAHPDHTQVVRLEHKMGLKGSPTCVLNFDGASGWPLGESGRGLNALFTMVNTMRLEVGVQAVALAGAALAKALRYAVERRQGGAPDGPAVSLIKHADVRRMLLEMRARTTAFRALTLEAALQLDIADNHPGADEAERARRRAEWLLPICKAGGTEAGMRVTNLAVQLFGGHGYVHESGVEQYVRDGRVGAIYEGTNGIQALDLIQRKLMSDGGERYHDFVTRIRRDIDAAATPAVEPLATRLATTLDDCDAAVAGLIASGGRKDAEALRRIESAATPLLELMALLGGGWMMLRVAAASRSESAADRARIAAADFYGQYLLPEAKVALARIAAGHRALDTLADHEFGAGLVNE
ncbi:MAG: acyl-CoA dehydrogenase [Steroidobacteraceae bacterium]